MSIQNALTVDVEDYYHVSAFARNINQSDWDTYPSRVEVNTYRLLDLFSRYQIKATFFVLGWIAERYTKLVSDIDESGHEVACHGYSHQLIYNQTRETFQEETRRAKSILEDLIQKPVLGYRAASYSITNMSKWALDILAEEGFIYDSSIFPIHHDRYGIPDAKEDPHTLQTPIGNSIVEFPLSTAKIFGYKMPVAGGGYFRLYPYSFTKMGLSKLNSDNRPFIFYLHPWEIDPKQPRIKTNLLSRFRHYNNLDKCEARLEMLLKDFEFDTVLEVLKDQKLITHSL
jgi:polysaccharide deacetylase family protein (PEP-CTERM system associated)